MIIEICNFGRQTFDKGRRREDSKYRNLRRAIQRTRNIKKRGKHLVTTTHRKHGTHTLHCSNVKVQKV